MQRNFKSLFVTLLAAMVLFSMCMSAAGAISVVVNGKKIAMSQPPIMLNGRVMVPIREVVEAMGVAVFYEAGVANCVTKDTTVAIGMNGEGDDSYYITIDGEYLYTDQDPINYKGKLMVPVRVISEAFGANVSWNKQSETVTVTGTISDSVRLSKAEIDAANAFTLSAARKKLANNSTYISYERNNEFSHSSPSFDKGVKSQELAYYHDYRNGWVFLIVSINGDVSQYSFFFDEYDEDDEYGDYYGYDEY